LRRSETGPTGTSYLGLDATGIAAQLIGFDTVLSLGVSGGAVFAEPGDDRRRARRRRSSTGTRSAPTSRRAPPRRFLRSGRRIVPPRSRLHLAGAASFLFGGVVVGRGALTLDQGTLTSTAGGVALTNADLLAPPRSRALRSFVGTGATADAGRRRRRERPVEGRDRDEQRGRPSSPPPTRSALAIRPRRRKPVTSTFGIEATNLGASIVGFDPSVVVLGVSGGKLDVNRVTTSTGAATTAPEARLVRASARDTTDRARGRRAGVHDGDDADPVAPTRVAQRRSGVASFALRRRGTLSFDQSTVSGSDGTTHADERRRAQRSR